MNTIRRAGIVALSIGLSGVLLTVAEAGQPGKSTRGKQSPPPRTLRTVSDEKEPQKTFADKDPPPYQALRLMFDVIAVQLDDQDLKELNGSPESPSTKTLLARGLEEKRTTVVHRIDTLHKVRTETNVVVGERRPYVVGRVKGDGEEAKQKPVINYENVGCILRLSSEWLKGDDGYEVSAKWSVEISNVVHDESIALSEDVSPKIMLEASQQFGSNHRIGEARLFSILTCRRSAAGDGEEAVLYVFRMTFLALD